MPFKIVQNPVFQIIQSVKCINSDTQYQDFYYLILWYLKTNTITWSIYIGQIVTSKYCIINIDLIEKTS